MIRRMLSGLIRLCGFATAASSPSCTQPSALPKVAGLDEAVALLGELSGSSVRPYSTRDFGRDRFLDARSVIVPSGTASAFVERFRTALPDGLVSFVGTSRWLGDEKHSGVEVVLARGTNQFDIVRVAASDAANYDMETEDLIRTLQRFDSTVGIDIFQAETDTVAFRLRSMPTDLAGFAHEVYEFCPDSVDQGFGTENALAKAIQKKGLVSLWWD